MYPYPQNEKCPKCGDYLKPMLMGSTGSSVVSFQCDNPHCFCNDSAKIDSQTQDFEIFVKCLSIAFKEFCLNQRMHQEIKTELYHRFEELWDRILIALELDYKIWLAKILENKPKCLKNYKFPAEYEITVNKIGEWRNKFLAHFNLSTLRNWKNFREENPLEDDSIRNLFNKIIEIAEQYNQKYNLSPNLKEFFQQIEKGALMECDKWLENFKQV